MAQTRVPLLASFRVFAADFLRYGGRRGVVAGILVAAGAVLENLSLLMLVPILGVVVDTGENQASGVWRRAAAPLFVAVGAHTAFQKLTALLVIYAALMLVRSVVMMTRDVRLAALQVGFLQFQRQRIAELLTAAPWAKLVGLRHARITHLMGGDLARVSSGANFLIQAAVSAVMLLAQCALAIFLAPVLAAMALVMLAIIGFGVAPLVRRSQLLGRFVTESNLSMLDATSQFLGGLKLAISQNLQSSFTAGFRETLRLLTDRQVDNVRQSAYARLVLSLLVSGVAAAIVLVGFGYIHTPIIVLGTVLLTISRMSGPVAQLQQGIQQVAYALPAYEQVIAMQAELAAVSEEGPQGPGEPFPSGAVAFEGVSYHHPTESDDPDRGRGVAGLDLEIRPGDFVGVAGPSGAGKTTFADLLVGLVPPQHGRVTVGGRPLDGPTLAAWRSGISYVSQDPFLFHDTVRRNLAWANPQASEAEMWRFLAIVDAEALVRRMDRGLDTLVGDRGALVSGGERQRIALARALLRRPRLLVLDEATNAIDIASERVIMQRLDALAPRPTIVMIAHRAESLALCRSVIQLEDGRLVDQSAPAPPPLAAVH